jgi:DNA helicase MCM8
MCLLLYAQVEDDDSDTVCLPMDFQQLQELCVFIKDKLNESPKEVLLCMGLAAHLVDVYSSYNLLV